MLSFFVAYLFNNNIKKLYLIDNAFSSAVLIGNTVNKQNILKIEQKDTISPNWWETDQLAVYKRSGGVEL